MTKQNAFSRLRAVAVGMSFLQCFACGTGDPTPPQSTVKDGEVSPNSPAVADEAAPPIATADQCPDEPSAVDGEGLALDDDVPRFFAPTSPGAGWQDGAVGAQCGDLARRALERANVLGMGDAARDFDRRSADHAASLGRLRAMFPNQEGFFSGIWSYTPEQLQQAGVTIWEGPGWRNRMYQRAP